MRHRKFLEATVFKCDFRSGQCYFVKFISFKKGERTICSRREIRSKVGTKVVDGKYYVKVSVSPVNVACHPQKADV